MLGGGGWKGDGGGAALKDNRAGRTSLGETSRLLHPLAEREENTAAAPGPIVGPDQTWQPISAEIWLHKESSENVFIFRVCRSVTSCEHTGLAFLLLSSRYILFLFKRRPELRLKSQWD